MNTSPGHRGGFWSRTLPVGTLLLASLWLQGCEKEHVSGKVLDDAVFNARVEISNLDGKVLGQRMSQNDGQFKFEEIPKEEAYRLDTSGGRIAKRSFAGKLSAICGSDQFTNCNLTPLTTLAVLATGSGGLDNYRTIQADQRRILGLPAEDPFVTDSRGQPQTAMDLIRFRERVGDGSGLDGLLREILADIADGSLDGATRIYFPNALTRSELLVQRAEAVLHGDPSVPITPPEELEKQLAPTRTPEAVARQRRLAHNHDLVLHATDPEPAWISTRASTTMLIVGPGESHHVDLAKLDVDGNVLGPVDTAKLRLELRIQRDETTVDYVPAEFQADYAAWDTSIPGRLNIHVPNELSRGRLMIGVRPNFTDPGQAAITERWSVPILVDVWPIKPGVTTVDQGTVFYPTNTASHLRAGSAFDLPTITSALDQARAAGQQPLKALVVKGMDLREGQLIDYRFTDPAGGVYPYGGRVVRVVAGADGQQLALVNFEIRAVYDVLIGTSDLLVDEGVMPEFVTYRAGPAMPPLGTDGLELPSRFRTSPRFLARTATEGGGGLFDIDCTAGISTLAITPFVRLKDDVDIGVDYSIGATGVEVKCKVLSGEHLVPLRIGGIVSVLLEKLLGTGIMAGPYGSLDVSVSGEGGIASQLSVTGSASWKTGVPTPSLNWPGSGGGGLDAPSAKATARIGGEAGIKAKAAALDVPFGWLGSPDISLEVSAGLFMGFAGEALNAAAAKDGANSGVAFDYGDKLAFSRTEGLASALSWLGVEISAPFQVELKQTVPIAGSYVAGYTSDDGNGHASVQVEPGGSLARELARGFGYGGTNGYASLSGSSVYNDPALSITYETSECQASGKISTPIVGCVKDFFCGNVDHKIDLCGGQVYVTPVSKSGAEGELVSAPGTVGIKPSPGGNTTPMTVAVSGSPLVPSPTSFVLAPGESRSFNAYATCPERGLYRGTIAASAGSGNDSAQTDIMTCTCPPGEDCDRTWASPHLVTADGLAYDYVASGDYILQRVVDDAGKTVHGMEVQARFLPGYEVSWPEAAAMQVGDDVVEVYAARYSPPDREFAGFQNVLYVKVNGQLQGPPHAWHAIKDGSRIIKLPSGGMIYFDDFAGRIGGQTWDPRELTVVWPEGIGLDGYGVKLSTQYNTERSTTNWTLMALLEIQLIRPVDHSGHERGMLGNNDGDPANDFMRRNGEVLGRDANMSWTALYGLFGGDWLVKPPECLFSDGCLARPEFPTSAALLTPEQRLIGEAACANLIGYYKEACIHDVGLSGQVDLVQSYYADTEDLNWMATQLRTPGVDLAVYRLAQGARRPLAGDTLTNPAFRQEASVQHVVGTGKYLLSVRPPRGASATFASGQPGSLTQSFIDSIDLTTAVDVHCGQPDPNWAGLGEAWLALGAVQLWNIDPLSGFATQLLGEIPLSCASNVQVLAAGSQFSVAVNDAGRAWAWGENTHGQLGNGTTDNANDPVAVDQSALGGYKLVSVAAGLQHVLALDERGKVWAWGQNSLGQLGDGTATDRHVPVATDLSALGDAKVVAVATRATHSLALDDVGRVWAWGFHGGNVLGDGSSDYMHTRPVLVNLGAIGTAKIVSIAAGDQFSLALDDAGRLWSWGRNGYGALGDGTTTNQATAVAVDLSMLGGAKVVTIAAGNNYSLALDDAGRLWSWGANFDGQLGQNLYVASVLKPGPVDLAPLGGTAIARVVAGEKHNLLIDASGRMWAWGRAKEYQLNDGSDINKFAPVAVDLWQLRDAKPVAMTGGALHSLVLDDEGRVWGWGFSPKGQLAGGGFMERLIPFLIGHLNGGLDVSSTVPATLNVPVGRDVSIGSVHVVSSRIADETLSISEEGVGFGAPGQHSISALRGESRHALFTRCDALGEQKQLPFRVVDLGGTLMHAGQVGVTCVADIRQAVMWSGDGLELSLSNAGSLSGGVRFTPAAGISMPGSSNWEASLGSGANQTLSLDGLGCPFVGIRRLGVLEFLDDRGQPYAQQVIYASGDMCGKPIAAGAAHSTVIADDGKLWAWGNNSFGQLGDGTTNAHVTPSPVSVSMLGGAMVRAVTSGGNHTVALDEQGRLWAWGENGFGQLGDGTTTRRLVPVAVDLSALGGAKVTAVAAGDAHNIALDTLGRVWVWGASGGGALGDGTTSDRLTPVTVDLGGARAVTIAAGRESSMAVDDAGRLWMWGWETCLGMIQTSPAVVNALGGGRVVSAAGGYHNMALDDQGQVWECSQRHPLLLDLAAQGAAAIDSIAAGGGINTAVDRDGRVWAWGYPTPSAPVPAKVILVQPGQDHALALDDQARIWAWGNNENGQVGDGTKTYRMSPVLVGALKGSIKVTADTPASATIPAGHDVSVGTLHVISDRLGTATLQVTGDGFSLGAPGHTTLSVSLGNSDAVLYARCETPGTHQPAAYRLLDSTGALVHSGTVDLTCVADIQQSVSGGTSGFSLSFANAGAIDAWVRFQPASGITIAGMSNWEAVLQPQGTQTLSLAGITCPFTGMLELGVLQFLNPQGGVYGEQMVYASPEVCARTMRIAAANGYSFAPDANGRLWAWGMGSYHLGIGYAVWQATMPLQVNLSPLGGAGVATLSAGREHALLLDDAGRLWSWGAHNWGQLGHDAYYALSPNAVDLSALNGAKVTAAFAGGYQSFAIDDAKRLWAWGNNDYGQLGDGTSGANRYRPVPADVSALGAGTVRSLASSRYHTLAVDDQGRVWAWGRNTYGALGDGTFVTRLTPTAVDLSVLGGSRVRSAAAGWDFSVALDDQGRLWSWGLNNYGQLGNHTSSKSALPVLVDLSALGDARVVSVLAGDRHVLALDTLGRLWSWGDNAVGQLGDGTRTVPYAPVQVNLTALGGVKVLSMITGADHNIALDESGRLWAWGGNANGQLGDGTTTNRWSPVSVSSAPLQGVLWTY